MLSRPKKLSPTKLLEEACDLIVSFPPEIVIPDLARVIWNADDRFCQKLDSLFMALLAKLPVPMWPVIDQKIRRQLECSISQTRMFRGDPISGTESVILIALCHSSGRIREEAIRLSARVRPSLAVPLLLIRVNDWVRAVRNVAAASLTMPLRSLDSGEKLALMPVLIRLREFGRHCQHDRLDSWLQILITPFDEMA